MMRKTLVVGDRPAPGGAVLPYEGPMMDIHGHRAALIGGRAHCAGCHSVGLIAKAGGPYRSRFHGAEMALEGDVVICHCPVPPPLVSMLPHSVNCDDRLDAAVGVFDPSFTALPGWFSGDMESVRASSKVVDGLVKHPPEAEQTENICPNMTNKEFCDLVLGLRDVAVGLVEQRLKDLDVWGKPEQQRVARWFGTSDDDVRRYLKTGFRQTLKVLKELTGDNFVRYSEQAMRNVGCTPSGNKGRLLAEVCGPDTHTRTIGIGLDFCEIRGISYRTDSKMNTLIHEVTHFGDTFSSRDTVYTMSGSLRLASQPNLALSNADSLTGYVVYGD